MASTTRYSLPSGYRIDPRLGAVYESVPSSADDLAVIRGIETREVVWLNRLGIYYFEQLASWTDSQTAAVADALGMSASTIADDRWIEQAQNLVLSIPMPATVTSIQRESATPLPASGSRTITVLVCALLIGCLFVSWLNGRNNLPMAGVLAAEITSLRVPADSRLLAMHASAGDEVFTGETLLTLEKSEHLEHITELSQRVQRLAKDLRRSEAEASLELQWRSQQLDQELSDTKRRARFFQTLFPSPDHGPEEFRSANASLLAGQFQSVSSPRDILPFQKDRVNALLFMSGSSGANTLGSVSSQSAPMIAVMVAEPQSTVATEPQSELLELEAENIESRLQQLERLRTSLPAQVSQVAGVENLRSEYTAAQKQLAHLRSLSRETAVLCPAYGTIGQVRYQEGDRMARDEVMVKILHADRRYVVCHAPVERIGELEPGTRLAVRFPGHDECQGVVASIPSVADRQLANGKSIAAVRVESTGRRWPDLPIGSKVEVRGL